MQPGTGVYTYCYQPAGMEGQRDHAARAASASVEWPQTSSMTPQEQPALFGGTLQNPYPSGGRPASAFAGDKLVTLGTGLGQPSPQNPQATGADDSGVQFGRHAVMHGGNISERATFTNPPVPVGQLAGPAAHALSAGSHQRTVTRDQQGGKVTTGDGRWDSFGAPPTASEQTGAWAMERQKPPSAQGWEDHTAAQNGEILSDTEERASRSTYNGRNGENGQRGRDPDSDASYGEVAKGSTKDWPNTDRVGEARRTSLPRTHRRAVAEDLARHSAAVAPPLSSLVAHDQSVVNARSAAERAAEEADFLLRRAQEMEAQRNGAVAAAQQTYDGVVAKAAQFQDLQAEGIRRLGTDSSRGGAPRYEQNGQLEGAAVKESLSPEGKDTGERPSSFERLLAEHLPAKGQWGGDLLPAMLGMIRTEIDEGVARRLGRPSSKERGWDAAVGATDQSRRDRTPSATKQVAGDGRTRSDRRRETGEPQARPTNRAREGERRSYAEVAGGPPGRPINRGTGMDRHQNGETAGGRRRTQSRSAADMPRDTRAGDRYTTAQPPPYQPPTRNGGRTNTARPPQDGRPYADAGYGVLGPHRPAAPRAQGPPAKVRAPEYAARDYLDTEDEQEEDDGWQVLPPPQRRAEAAAAIGRMQKPTLFPQRYDPAAPFEHYQRLFEDAAGMNGWDKEEMARFLPQALPYKVFETVAHIQHGRPGAYDAMVDALTLRYGASVNVGRSLALFEVRRQKDDEDPVAFAQALSILAGWAYPEMDLANRDILLKQKFLAGLKDRGLAKWVSGFEPRTIDEAVTKAVTLGTISETPAPRVNRYRPSPGDKENTPWVGQIQEPDEDDTVADSGAAPKAAPAAETTLAEVLKRLVKIEKAAEARRKGAAPQNGKGTTKTQEKGAPKLRCYNCNKEGHFSRECPLPQKERSARKRDGGDQPQQKTATKGAENAKAPGPAEAQPDGPVAQKT